MNINLFLTVKVIRLFLLGNYTSTMPEFELAWTPRGKLQQKNFLVLKIL